MLRGETPSLLGPHRPPAEYDDAAVHTLRAPCSRSREIQTLMPDVRSGASRNRSRDRAALAGGTAARRRRTAAPTSGPRHSGRHREGVTDRPTEVASVAQRRSVPLAGENADPGSGERLVPPPHALFRPKTAKKNALDRSTPDPRVKSLGRPLDPLKGVAADPFNSPRKFISLCFNHLAT